MAWHDVERKVGGKKSGIPPLPPNPAKKEKKKEVEKKNKKRTLLNTSTDSATEK